MSDLLTLSTAADVELNRRRVALVDAKVAAQEAKEALKAAKTHHRERLKQLSLLVANRQQVLTEAKRTLNNAKTKAAAAKYAAKRAYQAYLLEHP